MKRQPQGEYIANQLPGELLIHKYVKNSHKSKKAQTTRLKNGQKI